MFPLYRIGALQEYTPGVGRPAVRCYVVSGEEDLKKMDVRYWRRKSQDRAQLMASNRERDQGPSWTAASAEEVEEGQNI
jgi:hypothetical protein